MFYKWEKKSSLLLLHSPQCSCQKMESSNHHHHHHCTHTHTHTHTHIQAHTYTHTHIYSYTTNSQSIIGFHLAKNLLRMRLCQVFNIEIRILPEREGMGTNWVCSWINKEEPFIFLRLKGKMGWKCRQLKWI